MIPPNPVFETNVRKALVVNTIKIKTDLAGLETHSPRRRFRVVSRIGFPEKKKKKAFTNQAIDRTWKQIGSMQTILALEVAGASIIR